MIGRRDIDAPAFQGEALAVDQRAVVAVLPQQLLVRADLRANRQT